MLIRALMCSLLVLCAASGHVFAQSISIMLPNNNPEQLGYPTTYQVTIPKSNFNTSTSWATWQTDCKPIAQA